MKVLINGIFYSHQLTGIERFAHEISTDIDEFCSVNDNFSLAVASNLNKELPEFKTFSIVKLFKLKTDRIFNRALDLYLLFHKCICLDFANRIPSFGKYNVSFLHDIYCRVHPEDFLTLKDKINRIRTCAMYKKVCKRAKKICTVSEFSKKQIMEYYNVSEDKITVIYNGAEQMNNTKADYSVFKSFPEINDKEFYFTLGSLSLRKNLKWIAKHAELYPNETFVISGGALKNVIPPELQKLQTMKNVILAGYLSDGQIKALYEKCKAFVMPSYFEGFGIPPLEALSCGAPVIISNASCFPEIYGDCAHYINPENPDVDLDELLKEPVNSPDKLFEKYSFKTSAKKLYHLLKEIQNEFN